MLSTKHSIIIAIFVLLTISKLPAQQYDQGISHQAVIRDANNTLIIDQQIGVKISIIQGTPEGTVVYSETHIPISNANGLITFVIGHGNDTVGDFNAIDWSDWPYFVKNEVDPTGGTSYTIEGVSQMLSVPFALHAETAKKVEGSVAANIYPPTVIATAASNIESFSATMTGIVNAEGFSSTVVFEWGTTTAYGNIINAIQSPVTGSTDVMVSANLSNLQSATTYHYRIRATNAVNVSYSDDMPFTTELSAPQLTTNVVTNILAFSATIGGNITYDGGTPVTARGVVWSINPSPTLADNFTVDGPGTGSFTSDMTGLIHATTYYVRAYATNAVGTTYGNQRTFTTQSGIVALTTNTVTNILTFSATSGGNITADGGTPVAARGVVWSINPSPTLADNFTVDGLGTGSFTSEISSLAINTIYYVRAYATNAIGTTYGNERSFSTGIGAFFQGGIIAHILEPGDPGYVEGEFHGLIAAPSDQSAGTNWGCWGTFIGGTSTAFGTGAANTAAMIANGCCCAAQLCNNLELNGFVDWYLPSRDELYKLFINRVAIGGLSGSYWSSSEYDAGYAWRHFFSSANPSTYVKTDITSFIKVRAVRSF